MLILNMFLMHLQKMIVIKEIKNKMIMHFLVE